MHGSTLPVPPLLHLCPGFHTTASQPWPQHTPCSEAETSNCYCLATIAIFSLSHWVCYGVWVPSDPGTLRVLKAGKPVLLHTSNNSKSKLSLKLFLQLGQSQHFSFCGVLLLPARNAAHDSKLQALLQPQRLLGLCLTRGIKKRSPFCLHQTWLKPANSFTSSPSTTQLHPGNRIASPLLMLEKN